MLVIPFDQIFLMQLPATEGTPSIYTGTADGISARLSEKPRKPYPKQHL